MKNDYNLKNVLRVNLLELEVRSEEVRVNIVELHLVCDYSQGPAVPEVNYQTSIKQGEGEVVSKPGQTESSNCARIFAGACKVERSVILFKAWEGTAGKCGMRVGGKGKL